MTRFTRLESDILDALAWDLRKVAPDQGGQFAEALPRRPAQHRLDLPRRRSLRLIPAGAPPPRPA